MFRLRLAGLAATVALVLPIPGAQASGDTSLRDTLLAHEQKIVEAIRQQDEATLKEMLSEEYFTVTPDGGRQTGTQMFQSLKGVTVSKYDFSDVKVIETSENVGILTYRFSWSGSRDGKDVPTTTTYAISIWALRGGEWKPVFYQETPASR